MLEFEHIVQVNDLSNQKMPRLTRDQLWLGLVLRAKYPQKFNPALQCDIAEEESSQFVRKISAGDALFVEQVTLIAETVIETMTLPATNQIHAQSRTTIEEPEPQAFFVRFYYKRDLDDSDESVDLAQYLKSAYIQLDTDAVAMIRMLAQSEAGNTFIN